MVFPSLYDAVTHIFQISKMAKQSDHRSIRVLQFLDAYQKQESLWNPALESYKNKHIRDEAYLNIIRELNVPTLTINDIKLKVKSIRTTYTKELRLLTKHKEEGRTYQPKLFWFHRAHEFLKHVSLSREKRQNLLGKMHKSDDYKPCVIEYITDITQRQDLSDDMPLSVSMEDACNTSSSGYDYKAIQPTVLETHIQEDLNMGSCSEDVPVASLKHIEHSHDDFDPNMADVVPSSKIGGIATNTDTTASLKLLGPSHLPPAVPQSNADDEYDLFCRSVCAQLRSISDNYSRSVAKLKIQQILFEAETGHYRSGCNLSISASQQISNME